MESEVKAERQQLAAFHRAENGRPPAGVRLTGCTMAGVVAEPEAAVVRQMFTRFHAGGLAAWHRRLADRAGSAHQVRAAVEPSSVRGILTNPLAKPDLRTLLAKPASREARQVAEEIRRLAGWSRPGWTTTTT